MNAIREGDRVQVLIPHLGTTGLIGVVKRVHRGLRSTRYTVEFSPGRGATYVRHELEHLDAVTRLGEISERA